MLTYSTLVDINVVDLLSKLERFLISYSILSICYNCRANIVVRTAKGLNSISSLFKSAVWAEREVWDMFGIFFLHNSELYRILTDYGFTGYPLRKDFPVSGFSELRYIASEKRLMYVGASLSQELRDCLGRIIVLADWWSSNYSNRFNLAVDLTDVKIKEKDKKAGLRSAAMKEKYSKGAFRLFRYCMFVAVLKLVCSINLELFSGPAGLEFRDVS